MRIFFSVGEPSGDLHGANLIRSLRDRLPGCEYVGFGGPKMAEAGCRLHADLTQLAVMWVAQAIVHLRTFFRLLHKADRYFQTDRPDLVVLIDYPGFNWWIARKAKARGIPVVYYGTPQLWAWASWRVSKMRRFVDHVLCKLPFEEAWFRQRGCHATFVGHPYFDELGSRHLDASFVSDMTDAKGPLVTILPGSRTQELKSNLPPFLRTARHVRRMVPDARFAVAVYKPSQLELVGELVNAEGIDVEVYAQRTPELIQAARCCLACSGSVSLELLYHCKPSAILYQVSRFGFFVQSIFRKVRYITLVNLLTADDPFGERAAGIYDPEDPRDKHVLMPEYLTCQDRTWQLADHVTEWLTDEARHRERCRQLESLKERVAQGGASRRAAEYIAALSVQPESTVKPTSEAA